MTGSRRSDGVRRTPEIVVSGPRIDLRSTVTYSKTGRDYPTRLSVDNVAVRGRQHHGHRRRRLWLRIRIRQHPRRGADGWERSVAWAMTVRSADGEFALDPPLNSTRLAADGSRADRGPQRDDTWTRSAHETNTPWSLLLPGGSQSNRLSNGAHRDQPRAIDSHRKPRSRTARDSTPSPRTRPPSRRRTRRSASLPGEAERWSASLLHAVRDRSRRRYAGTILSNDPDTPQNRRGTHRRGGRPT